MDNAFLIEHESYTYIYTYFWRNIVPVLLHIDKAFEKCNYSYYE